METYSRPPANGRGSGSSSLLSSPGNPHETRKNNRSETISADRDLSKHYEECPELTEESLRRLEQGVWELSLEIVKLRSRIDPWLALTNNGHARRGGAPWE